MPQCFSQIELNDLVCDLGLSKQAAEVLASRLKEKNLLDSFAKVSYFRTRDENFVNFFSEVNLFVYCHDISGLLLQLGISVYNPTEWRLFIDSSKRSLKCVLLHNGNIFGSVPNAHSVFFQETYDDIKMVLNLIKYREHNWIICVDLKMVNFLLSQQKGFTKFPCYLCMWDSRARNQHWIQKEWPIRKTLTVGMQNIVNEPIVSHNKIVFPPLHLKLGFMKQFVKALKTDSDCIQYIITSLPGLSIEKKKAGVFNRPQIRYLIKDKEFIKTINIKEKTAWLSFVVVVKNFLGNKKAENYADLVDEMLEAFVILDAK